MRASYLVVFRRTAAAAGSGHRCCTGRAAGSLVQRLRGGRLRDGHEMLGGTDQRTAAVDAGRDAAADAARLADHTVLGGGVRRPVRRRCVGVRTGNGGGGQRQHGMLKELRT